MAARHACSLPGLRGLRVYEGLMNAMRMTPFRVICGVLWGAVALLFGIGAIYNVSHNNSWGEVAFGAVIAALAGWYDYRIWALKARKLWLIV